MNALQKEYSKILSVVDLSAEEEITSTLRIKKDVVIVVRPDHYFGLITDEGVRVVKDYLKKIRLQAAPPPKEKD